MDRLLIVNAPHAQKVRRALAPTVLWLAGLGLLACDASPPPPPAAAGRVQAVVAKAPDAQQLDGFCDLRPQPANTRLTLPPLSSPANAEGDRAGGPRWVNLWATWCKPCLEELPMIANWQAQWRAQSQPAAVLLVSVDREAGELERFRGEHPTIPDSQRLADADSLAGWMASVGLDPGAGLPLHVFTDGSDHIRCIRAGAVVEAHRPLVEHLLGVR